LLCITGRPLIFKDEIDDFLHVEVSAAEVPAGTPRANLDTLVEAGLKRYPNEFIQFIIWPQDEPNVVLLSLAKSPDADPRNNRATRFDAHTGKFLEEPDYKSRLTYVLLALHTDLYAGLAGKLLLGLMGILLLASVVSGVVLYGPWMRRLDFGTVRWQKRKLARWLDLHNLPAGRSDDRARPARNFAARHAPSLVRIRCR
jgi:uncharacterized iron-regulated membrane protein